MAFRRASSAQEALLIFGKYLLKKIGFCALGWMVLYFVTQPCRAEDSMFLKLFTFPIGVVAGGIIGWWMAEEAVEKAGFSGIVLWAALVAASAMAILPVEWILHLFTRWPVGFGGWMLCMSAITSALAISVWRASADD